jgi:hypothetical protein
VSYFQGNTTTVTIPFTTTAASTTYTPYYSPYPPYAVNPYQIGQITYSPPAEPDTPEAWLRRRVREVCELAA